MWRRIVESLKASARFWLWIRATVPVSLTRASEAGASKNLPPQAKRHRPAVSLTESPPRNKQTKRPQTQKSNHPSL